MNLSKKVKQVALIAALAFSVNVGAPKPAQAIVGFAHGNVALIAIGSAMAAVGGAIAVTGVFAPSGGNIMARGLVPLLGMGIALVGILILDGPSGPRLGYTELSANQREQLGISDAEYEVYEAQLEEIAALTDSGTASAVAAGVRTDSEAKAHFDREYAYLEAETLSVMAKIIQANVNPI